ncbi:hypothetical protein G5I_02531 [Acromyrmex echinatior]|uniref:Uncharacterized protein n=1 Tax=Acromyrmex echinatior TaxID=103372 RepID=F4WAJ3_ACREC|nr:hypothetical protein G5I_02531 [Acromyrmex echinatior]
MATALSTTGAELIGFQSQLCRVSHQPTPFRTAALLIPRNTPLKPSRPLFYATIRRGPRPRDDDAVAITIALTLLFSRPLSTPRPTEDSEQNNAPKASWLAGWLANWLAGAYVLQRIAANCEGPEFPVAD